MQLVIGLDDDASVATVTESLRAAGASYVSTPPPSLPDVLVAQFPDGDVGARVRAVRAIAGVRYAEPEQLRYPT